MQNTNKQLDLTKSHKKKLWYKTAKHYLLQMPNKQSDDQG